jgi:hypothetical protein
MQGNNKLIIEENLRRKTIMLKCEYIYISHIHVCVIQHKCKTNNKICLIFILIIYHGSRKTLLLNSSSY